MVQVLHTVRRYIHANGPGAYKALIDIIIIPTIGSDIFVEPLHIHQCRSIKVEEPVDKFLPLRSGAPVAGDEAIRFQAVIAEKLLRQYYICIRFQDFAVPCQSKARIKGI